MLFRETLNDELERKGETIRRFTSEYSKTSSSYIEQLGIIEKTSLGEIESRLHDGNAGAIPSGEISSRSFAVRFGTSWENHEQARRWASSVLDKRVTFAADGSQIYAGKETVVPIAAVQIGWFENPHDGESVYEKNARFKLLSPEELLAELEEPMNPDIRVDAARYFGEVDRISEFLQKKIGWQSRGERMPLAFFDNPLLVPFSQKGLQKSTLDATVEMVELSKETGVPIVGYVDRSYSRDLISMINALAGTESSTGSAVFDASILRGRREDGSRILESWGDRTCFCYSTRRGLEAFIDNSTKMECSTRLSILSALNVSSGSAILTRLRPRIRQLSSRRGIAKFSLGLCRN